MRLYHLTCEIIYGLLLPLAFVVACASASYGALSFLKDYAHRHGGSFEWAMSMPDLKRPSKARHAKSAMTEIDASHDIAPHLSARAHAEGHLRSRFDDLRASVSRL